MRYLLALSQQHEIQGREEYLLQVTGYYHHPDKPDDGFIPLIPVGAKGPDILFITGHFNQVEQYLKKHRFEIKENTLVLTTCAPDLLKKLFPAKTIYTPIVNGKLCNIYPKEKYCFPFDPTESELRLFNARGSLKDRLKVSYIRL